MENKSFIDKANTVADFNVSINICGKECDKVKVCIGLAYQTKNKPTSRSASGTPAAERNFKNCKLLLTNGTFPRSIYFKHNILCTKGNA